MWLNSGSLRVNNLSEIVGKQISWYEVVSVNEEAKTFTVLIEWVPTEIQIVNFIHHQNIICEFPDNHFVKIAINEDWLYILWIDEYEITLNWEIYEEQLIDYIEILEKMICWLDRIRIWVFTNTNIQIQHENMIEQEFWIKWNEILDLVDRKIRNFSNKRTALSIIRDLTIRFEQISEIIENLKESIAMYSDEEIVVAEWMELNYSIFLKRLLKLKNWFEQIKKSLNNKLTSVKNIMNLYWIKE